MSCFKFVIFSNFQNGGFHQNVQFSKYFYSKHICIYFSLKTVYLQCIKSTPKSKLEHHWSCIAHLSAEDMLKSAAVEEKNFKNIESE